MLKNKAFILFVILMLGFCYLGGVDNSENKKLDYEEINSITIINE